MPTKIIDATGRRTEKHCMADKQRSREDIRVRLEEAHRTSSGPSSSMQKFRALGNRWALKFEARTTIWSCYWMGGPLRFPLSDASVLQIPFLS